MVAVFFIIGLLKSRKSKLKYGFEVVTFWIELIKIAIIVIAIGLLLISLAEYNGIPIVLILSIGRHIYALGDNEKAARLSGVKTQRVMFLVYTNMGMLAALAGIIVAGRLNAATPKTGTNFELDAIASCFIGGV